MNAVRVYLRHRAQRQKLEPGQIAQTSSLESAQHVTFAEAAVEHV